jgi:hypothetical protein
LRTRCSSLCSKAGRGKVKKIKEELALEGITLHWFVTAREILKGMYSLGGITKQQLDEALSDEDFH